ncbi:MAG TPA: alpha/beta hydrolase-fold protein [Polyangia bacterium]|nr:alpha/beta hydrolase-fold protein [Polyangia bacterium]
MHRLLVLVLALALPLCCVTAPAPPAAPAGTSAAGSAGRLRFSVTLAREIAPAPTAGRLLVFLSDAAEDRVVLGSGIIPGKTWVAAAEIARIAPGETVELDPDRLAYPRPFSQARPGSYLLMALLDTDHNYAYHSADGADVRSPVVRRFLDPMHTKPVELTLTRHAAAPEALADTDTVKRVELESPLLSTFWGRPIVMRAGVVLPAGYDSEPTRRYPAVYNIHGFGTDHSMAWRHGYLNMLGLGVGDADHPMVQVFLDGSCAGGHHEFADSVNNGPWGRALVEELIPFLEQRFRLLAQPDARFLTGHSSGGWSSLWLQVTHPDFFGGTWSTAPDPVDFRSFMGVNVTPGSTENLYRRADGTPRNLVRMGGHGLATFEQFARHERVLGEYGGQLASFEWVFSPRGPAGGPLELFDRQTGELHPEVARAWQRYDIRRLLEDSWATLGPQLRGKLHIVTGAADTFHLDEPTALLCDFLRRVGSDATCELIPGRDHMDLYVAHPPEYPNGLGARITQEMYARFSAHQAAAPGASAGQQPSGKRPPIRGRSR